LERREPTERASSSAATEWVWWGRWRRRAWAPPVGLGAEEESAVTAEAALPLVAESARLSSCWSCRQLSPAEPSAGVEAVASLLWLGGFGWVGFGLGW
jgi:hypothetical protein